MDNNFNQINNQNNDMMGNSMGSNQGTANYSLGAEPQKPNILLGTLGALGAAIIGTIVWILIAAFTGYVIFFLGVGIAFLAVFLYEKLAKKIDIVGMIICLVFTCIAIYIGNKYGYICSIANEYDCSVGDATKVFDLACSLDESYNMDYIKNMILSYVIGIGYTVAMMFKSIKNGR